MPSDTDYDADLLACRAALRGGSRTFFAAARVLPPRVSRPATALYAFCREADDAVDLAGGSIDALQARLDRIYARQPDANPADRALAAVVERFTLPRSLLDALLEGFAWDAAGCRYDSLADLERYAARVAGTVGALMAVLMGARSPALVARACDLGVAMQLTNIARDVGEDARAGRLYLPRDWLREAGINPASWLLEPCFTRGIATVVQRLLAAADVLYRRAESGIAGLPADCRPGIFAARLLYAQIGAEIARNGHDSVTRRAVVPRPRKLALISRALLTAIVPGTADPAAPLLACDALVQAAAAPMRARRSLDERIAWLFDLFDRLDKSATAPAGGKGSMHAYMR